MINLVKNYKAYGLKEKDFENIITTLNKFPEIKSARIFGSRAKGNYKKGSDIDLAIYGELINYNIVRQISIQLNEHLPIPYMVDVVDYTHLKKKELNDHIYTFGKLIYERK